MRPPGKKEQFGLKNAVNLVFFAAFSVMLLTAGLYIASLVLFSVKESLNTSHPTSIPWISDKDGCEKVGRVWRDGKCWDYQHNPSF
ncbi:hypothetical protein NIES4074_20950 [Cylindrospermum sp. NIES-4074]|nr:hypothetical protein NIES4074_20950 [Cylindrospermum sp. NIES-4074]